MLELKGKYNGCKVFTDDIDSETISQLTNLLNQEFVSGSQVRIMPDAHSGKGCVIGTTMTITDKVVPNLVGVDIGCFTGDTKVWLSAGYYESIKALVGKSFIVDSFDEEQKCFVHSRAIALKTRENASLVSVTYKSKITNNVTTVRCTPDHKFLVSNDTSCTYSDVTWVEAKDLVRGMRLVSEDDYVYVENIIKLQDKEDVYCLSVDDTHNFVLDGGIIVHNCGMRAVKLAEKHLDLPNLDSAIHKYVPAGFEIHEEAIASSGVESFDTIHNYIDVDNMILRKGSISAQSGEKVIIPMNMRDGSLICIGKGNPDWNYSAPHGAGRILSRSKAKDTISMAEYQESMKGIYTTSVNRGTIDESPMAYKPIEEIMKNIKDTVEIVDIIKPVYNFKAGE